MITPILLAITILLTGNSNSVAQYGDVFSLPDELLQSICCMEPLQESDRPAPMLRASDLDRNASPISLDHTNKSSHSGDYKKAKGVQHDVYLPAAFHIRNIFYTDTHVPFTSSYIPVIKPLHIPLRI